MNEHRIRQIFQVSVLLKGAHAVISGGRKPTEGELREALAEFP